MGYEDGVFMAQMGRQLWQSELLCFGRHAPKALVYS